MVKEIRLKDKKKSVPQNKLEKMKLNQNRMDAGSASTTARRKPILPNPNVAFDGKFQTPNQSFPEMDVQEQYQASKKIHDLRFLK